MIFKIFSHCNILLLCYFLLRNSFPDNWILAPRLWTSIKSSNYSFQLCRIDHSKPFSYGRFSFCGPRL